MPLLLVTRLLVTLLLETLRAALALALRLLVALRRGLRPRRLPAGVRRRSAWMLTAVARLVAVVAATAAAAAPPPAPPAAVALLTRAAVWLRLVVARLALAARMRVGRRGEGFGFVVTVVAGAVGRERATAAAVGFGVHRFLACCVRCAGDVAVGRCVGAAVHAVVRATAAAPTPATPPPAAAAVAGAERSVVVGAAGGVGRRRSGGGRVGERQAALDVDIGFVLDAFGHVHVDFLGCCAIGDVVVRRSERVRRGGRRVVVGAAADGGVGGGLVAPAAAAPSASPTAATGFARFPFTGLLPRIARRGVGLGGLGRGERGLGVGAVFVVWRGVVAHRFGRRFAAVFVGAVVHRRGALEAVVVPLEAAVRFVGQLLPVFDERRIEAERVGAQGEQVQRFEEVGAVQEAFDAEAFLVVGLGEAPLHAADALDAAGVLARQAQGRAHRAQQVLGDQRRTAVGLARRPLLDGADEQRAEQHAVLRLVAVLDRAIEGVERAPEVGAFVGVGAIEEVADDRQQAAQRADLAQDLEAVEGVAAAQQPQDLLQHARRGAAHEVVRRLAHRRERLGGDGEAQARGELGGAQDAHRVLAEAHARVADRADQPRLQVAQAVAVVEDRVARRVEEQRVDGEVAAQRVLLRRAELVVARDQHVLAFVGRLRRAAERRALQDLGVAVEVQVGELEAPADDAAVAREDALDLLRPGLRRDVVVLGRAAEEQVAHAAANEVGLEARLDQALGGADRVLVEQRQVQARRGKDRRFDRRIPAVETV